MAYSSVRGSKRLNVGPQRILSWSASFERSQDHIGSNRRPAEDLIAEGVRKCVQDRRTTASHWRLADTSRADRRFRVWNFDGRPGHIVRDIQNCRRLGVVKALGQRQAVVLVVNP